MKGFWLIYNYIREKVLRNFGFLVNGTDEEIHMHPCKKKGGKKSNYNRF